MRGPRRVRGRRTYQSDCCRDEVKEEIEIEDDVEEDY